MDMDYAHYMVTEGLKDTRKRKMDPQWNSPSRVAFRKGLGDAMNVNPNRRILAFKEKPYTPVELIPKEFFAAQARSKNAKPPRYIPKAAERTLDAPNILDDYSLNLLDWGSTNVVAIALDQTVYLWDASNGKTSELMTVDDENVPITSVKWSPHGSRLALGLDNSVVELWDVSASKRVRSLSGGHESRVGSLSWNDHKLTSGGLDSRIVNSDVRMRNQVVETYKGHRGEICGLKWCPSGRQLASGGNDNLVYIWNSSVSSKESRRWLHKMDAHTATVKALAWCPFQNDLLASGGGKGDQCVKLWNTRTGSQLNSVDIKSAVSGLSWNTNTKEDEMELLSCDGCVLTLWNYPRMVKKATLKGHESTVLYMAESPDGCTVASAAADETLRFWNVFGTPSARSKPGARKIKPPLPYSHLSFIR